ncbi:MAG: hypothetical protein H7124_05425 [Phycisphaerales bacterium]|nr:hypothetical protein [Hyphomonadaceae bacterium]
MANVEDDAAHWEAEQQSGRAAQADRPRVQPMIAWFIFALARLWVVCLLLVAAAVAGISVYEYAQTKQELTQLRESPGAPSYAVVAYRRELARQIEAMELDEVDYIESETLPTPPDRPRQLSEIDNLRERNARERRNARSASSESSARPRRNESRVPD